MHVKLPHIPTHLMHALWQTKKYKQESSAHMICIICAGVRHCMYVGASKHERASQKIPHRPSQSMIEATPMPVMGLKKKPKEQRSQCRVDVPGRFPAVLCSAAPRLWIGLNGACMRGGARGD